MSGIIVLLVVLSVFWGLHLNRSSQLRKAQARSTVRHSTPSRAVGHNAELVARVSKAQASAYLAAQRQPATAKMEDELAVRRASRC